MRSADSRRHWVSVRHLGAEEGRSDTDNLISALLRASLFSANRSGLVKLHFYTPAFSDHEVTGPFLSMAYWQDVCPPPSHHHHHRLPCLYTQQLKETN